MTPGRAGRDVYGVPVYDCVRDLVAKHGPVDGSVISVPPGFVRDAAFEAIENGVKLIVIVTENIRAARWRRWSSWPACAAPASSDPTAWG